MKLSEDNVRGEEGEKLKKCSLLAAVTSQNKTETLRSVTNAFQHDTGCGQQVSG
jgi:hypothetical protein